MRGIQCGWNLFHFIEGVVELDAVFLIKINFATYCIVFAACLIKNRNFNIALVGLTYLAPLVPLGMTEASATLMFSSPCTRQYWSTTAPLSDAGPSLQVPEM